jgi:multicomponent Na+:H+ antiporter subunit D
MTLAPLPVAIPFLGAALIAAVRRYIGARNSNRIAIATAAVVFVICVALFHRAADGEIVYWFGGWRPRDGVALGIAFTIDRIGASLAALAALLVLCSFLFSSRYFDPAHSLYHVLMLSFLGAMCGFSLTGDLFNLFVFLELMSAAGFALCGYRTEEAGPLQGALNFAITNTVGAFLALSGIGLLYGRTGALNMAQIGHALQSRADTLVIVAFLLILCGFFVKAAIVPFHFWLADAHAVAPTPVCVVFSGIMVELGLYAVMRVYWTIFAGPLASSTDALRNILVGAGVLTALLGGLMCFAQRHLKRMLAYSTISHMGLMLIGFGLLVPVGLAGTVLYIFTHAMVKSSLFICAGILLHRFGTVDEMELRGRGRIPELAMQVTAAIWLLSALGLAGLPPSATYLADSLFGRAAHALGYGWVSYVTMAAEVLTAGAVLRAGGIIFREWGTHRVADEEGQLEEGRETHEGHHHVPPLMVIPAVVLLAISFVLGLAPGIRETAVAAAARFQDQQAYIDGVLYDVWHPAHAPQSEEWPLPGAVKGAAAALIAGLLAWVSLFRGRLRLRVDNTIRPLRLLHSGLVGDYITWLTVGVAVFGAFFVGLLG